MAFSQEVLDQAFARSGGRCECKRDHAGQQAHHRGSNCPRGFARFGPYWEPHHIKPLDAGGDDSLTNCEVLCFLCHRLVHSGARVAA